MKTEKQPAPDQQRGTAAFFRNIGKALQAFFIKFQNDWVMNFAAALAYNLLTAMFPIAVALLAVVGLFLSDPHALESFTNQIMSFIPQQNNSLQTKDLIKSIFTQLARVSGVLGIIAFLMAVFGGSRLFITLESYFSIIYHLRPRKILMQNVMAFGMLFLFFLLVPLMIFVSTAPAAILTFLEQNPAFQAIPFFETVASHPFVTYLAGLTGSILVGWIFFLAIYTVVPNQHISLRKSWLGALIASLALIFYLAIFGWYTSNFMGGYVGQAGFAVLLLTFFYYFSVILLLGAEVNAFFSEGIQSLPGDVAAVISMQRTAEQTAKASPPAQQPEAEEARQEPQARMLVSKSQEEANKAVRKDKGHKRRAALLETILGTLVALIVEIVHQRQRKKE
jgi:YihY family inner membrane protein